MDYTLLVIKGVVNEKPNQNKKYRSETSHNGNLIYLGNESHDDRDSLN